MISYLKRTLGTLAIGVASILPIHVARADDAVAPNKNIETKVEAEPKQESKASPLVLTTRNSSDKDGFSTQDYLGGDFGKLYSSKDYDVVSAGVDLRLERILGGTNNYRINIGNLYNQSTGSSQSRVLLERTFSGNDPLDFASIEYQDLDGKDVFGASLGLKFGDFKVQGTADSEGDYGYGLLFRAGCNANIGFGGLHTEDKDVLDSAFDYRITDGAFKGYKLTGQIKLTDFEDKHDSLDARIRFGDKAPAGAILAGVQDTLFNSTSIVSDVTFPFSIGKFDLFGAADSITGKVGTLGVDLKYKDNGSRVLDANVAFGLGSVTGTFFKDMKLQAGYKLDFDDPSKDVFSGELRGKLFESNDGNFQIEGGYRYEHPANGDDENSFFLGASWKF